MVQKVFNLTLAVLLMLGIMACSANPDTDSPLVPGNGQPGDVTDALQTSNEPVSGHNLWMYRQIFVDPASLTAEIEPAHSTAGHYNVLQWLEVSPCSSCLKVKNLELSSNGTLFMDIEISHPFTNPIFTGFDVRGIAMFDGSRSYPDMELTTPDRHMGDGELVNADGYTTLYNATTLGSGPGGLQGYQSGKFSSATLPNATLNGYKRHISDSPGNSRNMFLAGDSVTETYDIDMPDGPFVMGYAVDASWAKPLVKPVTNPITDFGPDANSFEPWKIAVTVIPEDEGLTELGGTAKLQVDVYSLYPEDYDIQCELPELFDDVVDSDDFVSSGDGYTRYEVDIENQKLAAPGIYEALIVVSTEDAPPSPDWIDLVAYQIVKVQVNSSVPMDPVAMAAAAPNPQNVNELVNFSDDGSFDPDGGAIALYEWDWDNDGAYDESGMNVSHSWSSEGVYPVQFRVTDNEGAKGTLAQPLLITIQSAKTNPVAMATASPNPQQVNLPVDFSDNGSYDPDGGAIVLYEWDWDYNGVYDETGMNVFHSWTSGGIYQVQFRVTDDENAKGALAQPLQITIQSADMSPVAAAKVTPNPQLINQPVTFQDNGSYDPDGGAIALYEWDWENDGVFDATGSSVNHSWSTAGVKSVQMRVTDDEGSKDLLDSPIQVTINSVSSPPVAMATANPNPQDAGVAVNFSDNGSNDPDGGSITLYQWDWDNNGTWDQSGSNVNHTWPDAGTYYVQFRVTDDESQTDTLDAPLQIVINSVTTQVTWDNTIGPMLGSNCSPCHISSSSGGKNYATYQNFVNSNVVDLGNPPNSKIYKTIMNHDHFGDLTDPQLQTLLDWIADGIPEN